MPGTKKVRRVKWALSVYQKLGPVQLHKLPIALYCPHFSCACHKNRLLLFRLRNSNSPFGAWVFCQVLHVMLSMGLRNLFDLTILINWLVLLLILRSKYLPLTFMIIFLSCFDITQPKKKEKSAHRQQGAVWGHQSICKLLISLRSLITQRLRRWYPTGGGGNLTAVTKHRLARRDIPPLYSSAWLSRGSLCCCIEFSGTAWESMTRQMFVISHGEACDRDRNQITEHRKGL